MSCLPSWSHRPRSYVFVCWRDYKETTCRGAPAAVSCILWLFWVGGWGTAAGCHGGEAVQRLCCCCSRAGPSRGPRPGRIRPLLGLAFVILEGRGVMAVIFVISEFTVLCHSKSSGHSVEKLSYLLGSEHGQSYEKTSAFFAC